MHRWVCPCGANNMLGVAACFRCGRPQGAGNVTLLDQGQAAPTVMSAPRRPSPWLWVLVPVLIFSGCLFGALALVARMAGAGVAAHNPTPLSSPPTIRQADVISYDPKSGAVVARCPACKGSGINPLPWGDRKCHFCQGLGWEYYERARIIP